MGSSRPRRDTQNSAIESESIVNPMMLCSRGWGCGRQPTARRTLVSTNANE